MSSKVQIIRCCAREILDSRGNPTVEATVMLEDGTVGVASVPSGASTGKYEAVELRDADKERYHGKGVREAVSNVCHTIAPAIYGMCASDQVEIDKTLCELDGTENKSKLGANATLAVSLACARACANYYHVPIYKYLSGLSAYRMPAPMFNILNGGAHSNNNIEIQEFMIIPVGAESFSHALQVGSEIYHNLGNIIKERGMSVAVGDEGGYAPDLHDDEEALDLILEAIERSTYSADDVKIALDVASSAWYREDENIYRTLKRDSEYSAEELISYYENLISKYPIISIEDGLGEEDYEGWAELTARLGNRCMLVGDDLFVTNPKRFRDGIERGIANSILIKPNQIGTLTETFKAIRMAQENGYAYILSHRSGETEDTTLADIAVATNAPFIKAGAPCRSERIAKYNRLLRIEASLCGNAEYGVNISRFAKKH
ncbi:MAG: phosphopyruvate hydratase [Eubacteriales bacterium]